MGLRVIVVQHGDKDRAPGDPGLTGTGHEQAASTGRWLAEHVDIAELRSSPYRRALETARAISQATGLPVIADERLRERMNWDGSAGQSLPEFLAEWARASADRDVTPASGDSSNVAGRRFLDVLDQLGGQRHGGTAVLVAHGGVTVDLLRTLLGDGDLRARSPGCIEQGMPSCGLTCLTRGPAGWAVDAMGWTGHLAGRPDGSPPR